MRRKLLLSIFAALFSVAALAGIRAKYLSVPPPDFTYQVFTHHFTGAYTSSVADAFSVTLPESWLIEAIHVTTRLTSGTITQYTIPLYNAGSLLPLKAAIDAYGGALATAGTPQWALKINELHPIWIPAGNKLTGSLLLAGSDSPTVTDATLQITYRTISGPEYQ